MKGWALQKTLLDEVDMTKISTIEQELLLDFEGNIILLINFKIIHLFKISGVKKCFMNAVRDHTFYS